MAATGPKMAKNFRDLRILIMNIFALQNDSEIMKNGFFALTVFPGSNLGYFYGFRAIKAILTPLHCSDHSKIEILAQRAVKWHLKQLLQNTLFDTSTPYLPNRYLKHPKWPPRGQKLPKFLETSES